MGQLANLIKRELRNTQEHFERDVPTLGNPELIAKKQSLPHWDPGKHPRDKVGRFVELGGVVDLPDGGEGRVLGVDENTGKVKIENSEGQVKRLQANEVTMVEGINEGPADRPLRAAPDPKVKRAEDRLNELLDQLEPDPRGPELQRDAARSFLLRGGTLIGRDDKPLKLSPKDRELLSGDDFNERDRNTPSEESSFDPAGADAANQFEVVRGENGRGGEPGQWTDWGSDLEIEMPGGGPTAQVTEDEHDDDKPWSAYVFADAEAFDSESQTFETRDQARTWAEEKLRAPDTIQPSKEEQAAVLPESGSQEMADLNARQRAEARAGQFFEDREPGSVSEEEYQAKVDEFLVEDAGGDVEQPPGIREVQAIDDWLENAPEPMSDDSDEFWDQFLREAGGDENEAEKLADRWVSSWQDSTERAKVSNGEVGHRDKIKHVDETDGVEPSTVIGVKGDRMLIEVPEGAMSPGGYMIIPVTRDLVKV